MLISALIAFATAFVLIHRLIRIAPRIGLVDVPNGRSMHSTATPRGAGIGIFIALIAAIFIAEPGVVRSYPLTIIAFFIVFLIGLLDDHKDASPHTKFGIIIIGTVLCYLEGIGIHSFGRFFGFELSLGLLALPFTLFAVSGFTNALNLVDGLDGLAGSISLVILAVLFYLGYTHDDLFITAISSSLMAAIAAFLFFNWKPAKIFLGDSGSLTIGFIISILSIKALDYFNPTLVLFIAGVPILDTLIVMIRRKRHGRSAFEADKTHLHHILLKFFNGNVKRTVISLTLMQAILSVTGIFIMYDTEQTFVLMLFAANYTILFISASAMLANQRRMQRLKQKLETLKKLQRGNVVCQEDDAVR